MGGGGGLGAGKNEGNFISRANFVASPHYLLISSQVVTVHQTLFSAGAAKNVRGSGRRGRCAVGSRSSGTGQSPTAPQLPRRPHGPALAQGGAA